MSETHRVDAVLEVSGAQWVTEKHRIEAVSVVAGSGVGRREPAGADGDGTFRPSVTSIADLQGWV
jgi:hypothetical protein